MNTNASSVKMNKNLGNDTTSIHLHHETCDPSKRAMHLELKGLAFSGGGIRSATFNLGILQGLAMRG
jgi:hypothetical protein